jgi:repressor of nif and glnA expression
VLRGKKNAYYEAKWHTTQAAAIVRAIHAMNVPVSATMLARIPDLGSAIAGHLVNLEQQGLLTRVAYGKYVLSDAGLEKLRAAELAKTAAS